MTSATHRVASLLLLGLALGACGRAEAPWERGPAVDLPVAGTLGTWPSGRDVITVWAEADGRVSLDGRGPLSLAAVTEAVARRTADDARVVSKGLRHLKNVQEADGWFGRPDTADAWFAHAVATSAMGSAYDMTGSPLFKGAARKSVDAIVRRRAWGATPDDTMLDVLLALPVAAAEAVNLEAIGRGKPPPLPLDASTVDALMAWARPSDDDGLAVRAGKLRVRALLGEDASEASPLGQAIAAFGRQPPPDVGTRGDLLEFAVGLDLLRPPPGGRYTPWTAWRGWHRVARALAAEQRSGDAADLGGSWDPRAGARFGFGRVATTAIAASAITPYGHVHWVSLPSGPRFGN